MTEPLQHDARARLAGLAALVAGGVVIGAVPILVRLADAGPAAVGFWRMIFAAPLLALMTWRTDGGPIAPSRAALIAGVMFALDLSFWHYGIHLTSVANATVLANLTPLIVTVIAWVAYRERPSRAFLLAVLIAVAGAWMMALARGSGGRAASFAGDALSTATALWYALYMLAVGRARRSNGAAQVMFWSTLSSLPVLLGAAVLLREPLIPMSLGGWAACAGLGLAHVAGQGAIAWALGRLPTSVASVVILIQPVVAAILGAILFAEALTPLQTLGGAVALAGVVLAQWSQRTRT